MKNILDKIIKISLYLLVFLLPLFFLPLSFEFFEFNKIYLLFFLVSVSFLAWLAKMVLVDKEIRFRKTPLDVPILIFLLVAVLSTIFSVDKNTSLFGFYGRFSNGLIPLLSLIIFYFLLTNNTCLTSETKKEETGGERLSTSSVISINGLLNTFFWSVFFIVLISYLSIFGIWQKIPKLPPIMSLKTFNPVSGSLEGLAIFLATITVLLIGMILLKGVKRLILYLLLILVLGLLIIIDFSAAWLILVVGLGLFLIFALVSRIFRENVNRLLVPILVIIVATGFLFINTSNFQPSIFQLPKEQILSQGISWKIAFSAVRENLKSIFWGSGIGNYYYDFVKFKPQEFNQNLWWQIRYDRAGSQIAEILGTMGILGFLSYLILISLFFLVFWFLFKAKSEEREKISLSLAMGFLSLFFSQFLYYQNIVLAFTFWFILGLGVVSWRKPTSEKVFSFKDFPELSLVFSTLLILLFLIIFGSYFFAIKFYLADSNYARSQLINLTEERTKILERTVSLNPNWPTYRIILARNYLWQISEELAKPLADQDLAKIQNLVAMAIDQAKRATEISPKSVAAWETLGMIYRDIQPFAAGATDWAIKSFEEAIKLEPKNPVLVTELGKLYLATDLGKAREYFAGAKELKSDYIDALIQEVLIYEMEQNLDEATKRMEALVINYPLNIEARFQLGRLYFNKERLNDAITQFENVLQLMPNHSNSLYSLGVIYTRKGEKEKAILTFEKVLELNPGNQDVIKKLEELKK